MRIFKILLIQILLIMPLLVNAQSYDSLWKQVDEAVEKVLPQTEMQVLQRIISKATNEKAYGQLLKAELTNAFVQAYITPDSLMPAIAKLDEKITKTEKTDPAMAAVYCSVLGNIYKSHIPNIDDRETLSKQYFARSLADPKMLASHQASAFEPMIEKGIDSKYFNHDLLSVLGFEAEDYQTLHDYYLQAGNREATLITALRLIQQGRSYTAHQFFKDSKYIASLDSLIAEYHDLPVCAEVAMERYNYMSACEDVSVAERMAYLDKALLEWGNWKRMNMLRNEKAQLIQPMFHAQLEVSQQRPNIPTKVQLPQVRNIPSLTLRVSKLNITGEEEYNPYDKEHLKKLKQKIIAGSTKEQKKSFTIVNDYDILKDSLTIEGLPIGIYLLEFATEGKNISPQYLLLNVSNLFSVQQYLPGKKIRVAVLDATTGQPVAKAKVKLEREKRYNAPANTALLETNDKGEVVYEYGQYSPQTIYVYTATDKASPKNYCYGGFSYTEPRSNVTRMSLFTDRSIYRPGQTVYVGAILMNAQKGQTVKVLPGQSFTLTLRDANHQVVKEEQLTTDAFGSANTSFTLPNVGLNGNYYLQTNVGRGSTSFKVEEYKRPTFQVEFDKYEGEYHPGDSVKIKGHAKSYAGVPVQGAKVSYTVNRKRAFWCWWRSDAAQEQLMSTGEVTTDEQGAFEISVPMVIPEGDDTFYRFVTVVDVTDAAGETHAGEMSLPLGRKSFSFYFSVPEKQLKDSLQNVTFVLKNAAGNDMAGKVSYTIDGKNAVVVDANTPVPLNGKQLSSGKHTLEATCNGETMKQDFVVFSLTDKKPCIDTPDWYYLTGNEFPRDNKEGVTLQVGSSRKDTYILYTIVAGNTLLESGSFNLSDAIRTRVFKYQERYGTGIALNYIWVKDGICYNHSDVIRKPLPDKRLRLSWTTFRDQLLPGQKEEWTLQVLTPDGKPADARMMATMYDKSLDQLKGLYWNVDDLLYQNYPNVRWIFRDNYGIGIGGQQPLKYLSVSELLFSHLSRDQWNTILRNIYGWGGVMVRGSRPVMRMAKVGSSMEEDEVMAFEESASVAYNNMSVKMAAPQAIGAMDEMKKEVAVMDVAGSDVEGAAEKESTDVVRENLNETAFFYPTLTTDEKGAVSIRFTLPESVTSWRFLGLAHDKTMNYGFLEGETVAKKEVMVQPNIPRFIRRGDYATISTRIFNTSDHAVSGTVKMQLIDPVTEKIIHEESQPFSVEKEGTAAATFSYSPTEVYDILICKIVASGDGFSDGEQHYLPVLTDVEKVMNTLPFTQHDPGVFQADLRSLIPADAQQTTLTLEYTNNPAWLVVQSLPFISYANEHNAVSLSAAYYANSLGKFLLDQSPAIKKTFDMWKQEKGEETSLMSSLEKDQSLKTLVLSETPWVMDAKSEQAQKESLIRFFDENSLQYQRQRTIDLLRKLQHSDGSFSWWQGMDGSPRMTAQVMMFFTRLRLLCGDDHETETMVDKGFRYLSEIVIKEVKEMRKREKEGKPVYISDYHALQWAYLCAISGRTMTAQEKDAVNYLITYLEKQKKTQTLYSKAMMAVVFQKNGQLKKAKEYIQSLKEYSVFTEEMGRYYDTPRAAYSWCNYRIPTQVAAIEAMNIVTPEDEITVDEMRRWLLQEKRTTCWDTPINSVDAVYAFLNGKASLLNTQELSVVKVDGKMIELPKATAGLGYVKTGIKDTDAQSLTVEKSSEGTSWGAVYAQFFQPTSSIEASASGISVKREIRHQGKSLSVGDKVTVRLTIVADRDYDYVQVVDKRAACLEPVNQLSGYHWGYYISPKDCSTNYYFDILPKGTHVIETAYYIDRKGDYETGTCTVQCAYSPEYYGRAKSQKLTVKE